VTHWRAAYLTEYKLFEGVNRMGFDVSYWERISCYPYQFSVQSTCQFYRDRTSDKDIERSCLDWLHHKLMFLDWLAIEIKQSSSVCWAINVIVISMAVYFLLCNWWLSDVLGIKEWLDCNGILFCTLSWWWCYNSCQVLCVLSSRHLPWWVRSWQVV